MRTVDAFQVRKFSNTRIMVTVGQHRIISGLRVRRDRHQLREDGVHRVREGVGAAQRRPHPRQERALRRRKLLCV